MSDEVKRTKISMDVATRVRFVQFLTQIYGDGTLATLTRGEITDACNKEFKRLGISFVVKGTNVRDILIAMNWPYKKVGFNDDGTKKDHETTTGPRQGKSYWSHIAELQEADKRQAKEVGNLYDKYVELLQGTNDIRETIVEQATALTALENAVTTPAVDVGRAIAESLMGVNRMLTMLEARLTQLEKRGDTSGFRITS